MNSDCSYDALRSIRVLSLVLMLDEHLLSSSSSCSRLSRFTLNYNSRLLMISFIVVSFLLNSESNDLRKLPSAFSNWVYLLCRSFNSRCDRFVNSSSAWPILRSLRKRLACVTNCLLKYLR